MAHCILSLHDHLTYFFVQHSFQTLLLFISTQLTNKNKTESEMHILHAAALDFHSEPCTSRHPIMQQSCAHCITCPLAYFVILPIQCLTVSSFLSSNDKNLCSKALVSGVSASSKKDLEAEVGRSRRAFPPLQDIKTSTLPQVSLPMLSTDYTSVQPHSRKSTGLSLGLVKKGGPGIGVRVISSNCIV